MVQTPVRSIEEIIADVPFGIAEQSPVTYLAVNYKAGQRILLPQSIGIAFQNNAVQVHLNNLAFDAHNMYLVHDGPMWIEAQGDLRAVYVVPGIVQLPKRIWEKGTTDITPLHIYLTPAHDPLDLVLQGERKDPKMDALRSKSYMLTTRSPKLVHINGTEYDNIDTVPMHVTGTMVITPHNLVDAHTGPLTVNLRNAEATYK